MIQIGWKEVAARVSDLEGLERIAHALLGNQPSEVNIFFEFDGPEELIIFCQIARNIQTAKDIDELTKKLKERSTELDSLDSQKAQLQAELEELRVKKAKKVASLPS